MTLGAPLGLLALGALLPLAAAYFLRRKQPPRAVSALFLWRSKDLRAEAGPRFERFSREVSLALEALAVVMAALYLSDARWGADARLRHLVVVVDGSLSMRARVPGGEEVAGRVRAAVARLARTQGAGVLTVISSGLSPTVVAGPSLETARALALLETWSPAQPHHDLAPALLLARELATAKGQHITLFTDGPLPAGFSLPPQVEVRGLGTPLDNVGLLSAHRRDADGKAVVAVRVGSFAAAARSVVVRFATESGPVETKVVDLAAGASAALRVVIQTQASVEVSLPEDALVEDGRVTLGPAPEQEVAVALLDGLEPSAASAVRRFVDAASGVRLEAEGPLTFGPPGSSARVKLGARGSLRSFVGPFFAQRGSGLLDDVQLGGVVWTAGENPPGRPLVSAGDAVLVSEEEDGALHFNLALSRSNAQRTAAWPVLLGNVVRLTRLGLPGLPRRLLVLGDDVPVATAAGATWLLAGPHGEERPILGVGALTLPPLSSPGHWRLLKDGKPFDALEVLAMDARESDLRTRGSLSIDAAPEEALASLGLAAPRPMWPMVAMLGLLLLDFWWTARRSVP